MIIRAIITICILAELVTPTPVVVRFRLAAYGAATKADLDRIAAEVRRGLFADSTLLIAGRAQRTLGPTATDSGAPARTLIFDGKVNGDGEALEVQLRILNILAQPVAGPDTIRVLRTGLDSALVLAGQRYAALLAQPRSARRPSDER